MKRSKSSSRWLQEHASDPYVKRAHREGWRSRAVFKLEQIQRADKLLRPGMIVVDLGAAPGGWSQFAARALQGRGEIFAVDILAMPHIPGVTFIEGDFQDQALLDRLLAALGGRPVDLVMSDLAPNMSGIDAVDQPRCNESRRARARTLDPGSQARWRSADEGFSGRRFPGIGAVRTPAVHHCEVAQTRCLAARSAEMYLLARSRRMV